MAPTFPGSTSDRSSLMQCTRATTTRCESAHGRVRRPKEDADARTALTRSFGFPSFKGTFTVSTQLSARAQTVLTLQGTPEQKEMHRTKFLRKVGFARDIGVSPAHSSSLHTCRCRSRINTPLAQLTHSGTHLERRVWPRIPAPVRPRRGRGQCLAPRGAQGPAGNVPRDERIVVAVAVERCVAQ